MQPPSKLGVLDRYVTTEPGSQNAVDIFRGEWSSVLPDEAGARSGGNATLFDDARIAWFIDSIGGVSGKGVLELGPLEAGHTWMLERGGARSILAMEANTGAFLRCLVVKELLGIQRARFLCGDFLEYLRRHDERFQVCIACGVLYHMQNPAELIALLARCCTEHVFIWTHYYDAALISGKPAIAAHFSGSVTHEYRGFSHTLHCRHYQGALAWGGFCGAGTASSYWMSRDDIFRCLAHFGLEVQAVGFDDPDHTNGPAIAVIARPMNR